MGVLIDGTWRDEELPQETGSSGEFRRADSRFRGRITADGSSGFQAEPGRYHLYVAHGCPWAHRTLIYCVLKKLDGLISVAYAIPGLKRELRRFYVKRVETASVNEFSRVSDEELLAILEEPLDLTELRQRVRHAADNVARPFRSNGHSKH